MLFSLSLFLSLSFLKRNAEKCPKGRPARSAAWLHSSDSARDEQGMWNVMVPPAALTSQHRIPGSSIR